jgi:microcystin degradation protein MlrC
MRIGMVLVSQETDTFNPAPTTIDHFASYGIHRGRDVLDHGERGQVAGHLAAASERGGVETIPIFSTKAVAGGRLSADTLGFLVDEVVTGIERAGALDGLALQLHGACVAEGVDDVEAHLLRQVRDVVGDDLPIGLGLDHHANITADIVSLATFIVGHRTQPHDLFDTGLITSRLLFRVVAGEVAPVSAWRKLPLLSHQEQFLTDRHPMKTWFDRARSIERDQRVLQAATFPMQPWLDVDQGGWSTVVSTDGAPALAEELAEELADLAWSMREEFQTRSSVPPGEAVARAASQDGLVVLSDTGDSVRGGAGGDSTVLLRAFLDQGVTRALVPLVQPDIGELLAGSAEGDVVAVTVGGSVAGMHEPIAIEGVLRRFGEVTIHLGGDYPNPVADLGWTAVVEVPCGHVVITQRTGIGGVHPDMYRQVGIDPTAASIVVIKTASNFQYFAPIAVDLVRADTPGPTQSDLAGLPWRRIPRPVYPLDPSTERSA